MSTAKDVELLVGPHTYIKKIKEELASITGIPFFALRLKHGSLDMDNNRTLSSYTIENKVTLSIALPLAGGMQKSSGSSESARNNNSNTGRPLVDLSHFVDVEIRAKIQKLYDHTQLPISTCQSTVLEGGDLETYNLYINAGEERAAEHGFVMFRAWLGGSFKEDAALSDGDDDQMVRPQCIEYLFFLLL